MDSGRPHSPTSGRSPANRPLVVAHRGGRGLAPENTLAAFRNALALGADAVELDVRLTRDGLPVVLHDATLDRTTTGRGLVAEWSLGALQSLDATRAQPAGDWPPEPPPPLAAVLQLLGDRATAYVELKGDPWVSPALLRATIHEVRSARLVRTMLLAFDWEALGLAARLAPDIPRCALSAAWPHQAERALAELAADGVAMLGVTLTALTLARLERIRAAGLATNVWTVNADSELRRAVALGVDAITTDYPDRLLALLARESPDP